jgi:amino acid adenylation domain-containing protein
MKRLTSWQYDISIDAVDDGIDMNISLSFKAGFISRAVAKRVAGALSHVINSMTASPVTDIGEITLLGEDDLAQLWTWNKSVPDKIERYVHHMFEEQARRQPDANAVSAWDGELSYSELDDLSTQLAHYLIGLGVRRDVIVPMCFEKSLWAVVSMLGVLKAGGGFVSLDPEGPADRRRLILQQTRARLVLTSRTHSGVSLTTGTAAFAVYRESLARLGEADRRLTPLLDGKPDSTAYIIFTSGSTGMPKGVVVPHDAFASAVHHQARLLGHASGMRVYDFASYTFDVSLQGSLMCLATGGCLCVPSDWDRKNDLSGSMRSMEAELTHLTPSVARTLDREGLPRLKFLVLGGEAPQDGDKDWPDSVRIINTYGPAETTPSCSINMSFMERGEVTNMGFAAGSVLWVVDSSNHSRLVPIGAVGELVVEGALVGNGYLDDPERTSAVFIEDPPWLLRGAPRQPGRRGRLYKTGDLVRHNEDGSLIYIARRDTQVKLRGQRIELVEVEHHVRACMPHAIDVVAEVIELSGESEMAVLAVFVSGQGEQFAPNRVSEVTPGVELAVVSADVEAALAQRLPSYMMPSVYFYTASVPLTSSGKTDRRRLREKVSFLSAQRFAELRTAADGEKRQPRTEAERRLQHIWAELLKVKVTSIGIDDSFLRLGGDSIVAMKVVGEARRAGLEVEVADMFRYPKLRDVASRAHRLATTSSGGDIPRIGDGGPVEQSFAQERLWFMDQLYPGLTWYHMPCVIRLRGPLRLDALGAALLAVESRHETLRTTFLAQDGVNLQVVRPVQSRELEVVDMPPDDEKALTDALHRDRATPFHLVTEPGWRVKVYRIGDNDHVLSIVLHHIISDGWSNDIIRRELTAFYAAAVRGEDPLSQMDPLPIQYRDYSVWQKQQEQVDEHQRQLDYWVGELRSSQPAVFLCDKTRPTTLSGEADMQEFMIDGLLYDNLMRFCREREVTPFVVLLAAFRATHYLLTGSSDATIGTANANRDRWEVKDLIGFFVNLQCVRVKIEGETFEELVSQVQHTVASSFDNQDVPFERIVSKLHKGKDLSRHPLVQVIFALHSQVDMGHFKFEGVETEMVDFSSTTRYDLEFHLFQERQGLRGIVAFSTDLYEPETVANLISLFDRVLERGLGEPKTAAALSPQLMDSDYAELDRMGLVQRNSAAYVVDRHQLHPVPLGVIGELVVAGDDPALGYTNGRGNMDSFVEVTIGGRRVRAFRTGDYARNRPTDGQLEIVGRKEDQVEIRGQRIDLGVVERVLREHEHVNDAAVILQNLDQENEKDTGIVAFATLEASEPEEGQHDDQLDKDEVEQVGLWEDVFNTEMYGDIDTVETETLGRDFLGWTSAYDGSDIDRTEMNEWLDDTIDAILNGGAAGDVLEIGSGSGMILFNLTKGLRSYVGLEPADKAIDFVTKTAKAIPTLEHKVEIHKGTAADVGRLRGHISPNLVVVNSVAQYFPSQEYLFNVVKELVGQQGTKTVFFGDIRSHALHKEFQVTKAVHLVGEAPSKKKIRQKMAEIGRAEKELLVDPAFFTALPDLLPDLVRHVEILPKRVRAVNELSCYRYSAVLHVKNQDTEQQQIYDIVDGWIDFVEHKLDRQSLLRLLQCAPSSSTVAVANIPNDKTIFERHILDALEEETDETDSQTDWMTAVRQKAQDSPSLCTLDLADLARMMGYQVEISWARQHSQRGALDAVFHKHHPPNERGRVMFRFPSDHASRPLHSLCNQPLRQRFRQKIQGELQDKLNARLPDYMIPRTVTILDKIPTNENGEVDRQALALESQQRLAVRVVKRQPTTQMEQLMQKVWSSVLDLDQTIIGLDDSFFQLGGDSIAAMSVAGDARKVGINLAVADIFRYDTLASLAQRLDFDTTKVEEPAWEDVSVDPVAKVALLQEVDSLNIDISSGDIADILPITNFQEKTVVDGITSGQFCNYFHLDLGSALDIKRLKRTCLATLERFPILRTCFLVLQGKYWQVVLHQLRQPLRIQHAQGDLDESFQEFCLKDIKDFDPKTPPTTLVLLKHKTQGYRLVVRMSHAQYDGVCLPVIFESLIDGYNGKPLPSIPSFSTFLSYASNQRYKSMAYWRELLKESSPTPARPKSLQLRKSQHAAPQLVLASAEIDLPRLTGGKTTSATLASAAWALLLSQITGGQDLIYGYVVAGRNSAMQGVEKIVGPCLNVVPIRAKLSSLQTPAQLLHSITQQFIAIGEADSLGFKDIIENCTNWPAGVAFDTVIQFQNIDEHPILRFEKTETQVQFFENPHPVPPSTPSLGAIFYPQDDRLLIKIRSNSAVMTMEAASALLECLCGIISNMTKDLDKSLVSFMDSIDLDI